jgi:hypothetical protein
MSEKVYGYSKPGKPINNEMIEQLVEDAELSHCKRLLTRKVCKRSNT